jgi:hypothetical protein
MGIGSDDAHDKGVLKLELEPEKDDEPEPTCAV